MALPAYSTFEVPVAGGSLHVGRWGSGPKMVVAAHGITGNHRSWQSVARALDPSISLIAPDLRGRGLSNTLPEPFGQADVGVLPRLVHSRFGLHVVEVLAREPGVQQAFDAVRGAVSMSLQQKAFVSALQQYLRILAGAAVVEGVDLEAADTPLVQ